MVILSMHLQKKNIIGCQFHPEKSSATGLKILENFLKFNIIDRIYER